MQRILLIFLLSVNILFSNTLVVTTSDEVFTDFQMDMFEDKSSSLALVDIEKKVFTPVSNRISTGYSKSNFWFRFKIKNKTDKTINYILTSTENFAHEVDYYILSNDSTLKYELGLNRYTQENIIDNQNPKFSFKLQSGQVKEIYIRQLGLYTNHTSFKIFTKDALNKYTLVHDKLMSLYFGAALALILYNLFIFFTTRDKIYLTYVFYVSSFIIWQLSLNGFPPFESFNSTTEAYLIAYSIPSWLAFLILFSCQVLDMKKLFPKYNFILKSFAFILFTLAIYTSFDLHIAFILINIISSLALPLLLYIGFLSYQKGNKAALFYLIALGLFLPMSTLYSLMSQGLLEYNLVTRHGIVLGSFFEILLFSFALAYKLKTLKDEKLELIHHAKNRLELKVQERTEELSIANKKLLTLTVTDKLTQLLNRLGLDKSFKENILLFQRYKTSFGIILIDIDFFKTVNDKYGHLRGDCLLKDFANILKKSSRETDVVGRWGGEEFLIICPSSTLEGTLILAETLRSLVDKHCFEEVGHKTASFGVAIFKENDTTDSISNRADQALYQAKNSGRNKVCS